MARTRLPRRNFCIRLRHNALSALEVYKIRKYRRKYRRYGAAAIILTEADPAFVPLIALSALNRFRARRLQNKVWTNPLPLERRRKLFIDQWADEVLYQDFGFEKNQLHAICLVGCITNNILFITYLLYLVFDYLGLANSSHFPFADSLSFAW